jgi:glycerate kinase
MAQASGLTLVAPEARDAGRASSYGTGQLVKAALDAGCRNLMIGLGGSATTDGGAGALQALGLRLLDKAGNELPPGGKSLRNLETLDISALDARLADTSIQVLCDVTNPLCGENGAAAVYGPQKGASAADVTELDAALGHFADIAAESLEKDLRAVPGAGAAGGLGFGLMSFLGGQLVPGIEAVLAATDFRSKLENADLVFTAEGALDFQTPQGKALGGIANAARQARGGEGVPVVAFGGAVKLSGAELAQMGICAALPLPDMPQTLEQCFARAGDLLADAAERATRLWLCGRSLLG